MKFEVGDKVLVVLSNEEGEVVEIVNDKMVMVNVRGVKFPAYTDHLEFPYFKRFSEQKKAPPVKPKTHIDQLPKEKYTGPSATFPAGVWLLFLPKFENDEFGDEVVTSLKIHLINGTSAGYKFHYKLNYFGKMDFDLSNEIGAQKDFYLHDIAFSSLNDAPVFECEFSLVTPEKSKADYYETSLKLKPRQLFATIEEIKRKGEPSFSYKLFDTYPVKTSEDKIDIGRLSSAGFKIYDASRVRQNLAPARTVVDLHIEKLTNDWQHLSNFEILAIQLKEFDKYYDLAIAHRQPTLIVVHGLGTGKLRDEVHEQLRLKKEVKYFVNQYHPSFGHGATEIYFQY
jgi:hypothetical protein